MLIKAQTIDEPSKRLYLAVVNKIIDCDEILNKSTEFPFCPTRVAEPAKQPSSLSFC